MRVVFSPEAKQEFEDAERYYNLQVPQLGSRFAKKYVMPCRAYEHGPCRVK
jgi:hypothetical protein